MIHFVEETGSTNADLLTRLREGERIPEGEWLVARRQSAGRGRQGRQWFDGSGNFMGSTVVRQSELDPPAHTLALVAGLAVYEAVVSLLPNPSELQLKWPNDVLYGAAKLSGILLEAERDAIVIGIGVNLVAAPEIPDRQAISLAEITSPPPVTIFAETLAGQLDKELERWRSYGLEPLLRRWTAAATPAGTALKVHEPDNSVIEGEFAGLDDGGNLLLRLANGAVRAIHAGDVMLA